MKPVQKLIVIASILKPVDDTRMYEKMAVTLAASGRYEVIVIGFPASRKIEHSGITFLPSKKFRRLSLERLISPFRVFQKILKVKPEVLIVNSHELLIVAIVNRILFGTTLIYDVQENYYRNLKHTKAFPVIIRTVLAWWVRLKEKLSVPFFKWFYLAEKGYVKEMTFLGTKYTVLENKAVLPSDFKKSPRKDSAIRLLFSGTLAESTGVFQAINLARELYPINPNITLKIIGYCAQAHVLSRIREAIQNCPFIKLAGGGDQLVPHHRIMDAISEADFGIICYPASPHTQNSIPTKLYEYLACSLPVLIQNHLPWIEITAPLNASIVVHFDHPDAHGILRQMHEQQFYSMPAKEVTWDAEASRLLQSMNELTRSEKV